MKRRHFLALTGASASGLLAGCKNFGPVTKAWFKDSKYQETLSAFLITADGKKLVVLGQKYHYIFDMPPELGAVLKGPYRPKLRTAFIDFVAQGDKIGGRYRISLDRANVPPESDDIRALALADGFKDEGYRLTDEGSISGTRYLPNNVTAASVPQAFNQAYEVTVTEKPTAVGEGAKLALSPITMAADGALGLLGFALFPIALTVMIIAW
ncbi:5-formyltetrahydrofolate cyclo-ligase [Burkholderia sp. Ac-20353]|uniref:5-formyltetrahydrofolate cyclo-ligase n=1 Tax=Burkholderia sp. Ac-20353 TaxID=2703894 RepID=UPI00197BE9AF|nr:5-formyltetrahydrofolate cyclo-ligase [Burkholderia sp. Ac-20353]MBN3787795.1 5-formyltetrahydrofolate cyclo-ligase [Burkholderia sp. Ac-20353]